VAGKEIARTADGMEITTAASLIGHHVLVTGLLNEGLLAKEARIVIAGSEAARGDVPMMGLVDIPEFAAAHYGGDRVHAIETIAQALEPYQYKHMPHYAMVKTFVALWAAALARRLPDGMTVNAVSPGSAPASNAMRNQTLLFRLVVGALAHTIGPLAGMAAPLSKAAQRYTQAASFSADINGRFFASPPGKMTGALVEQRQPHILDHENQEAAWEAIERLSGRVSIESIDRKIAA
jgi:NAD(P)-dependent dehydrogenase (short-subunit alcohol dehydrogenase family)